MSEPERAADNDAPPFLDASVAILLSGAVVAALAASFFVGVLYEQHRTAPAAQPAATSTNSGALVQ